MKEGIGRIDLSDLNESHYKSMQPIRAEEENMSCNDFTLEELELIQNNLNWEDCHDKNLKLMAINNKLTAMISTYCDHDFYNTYNEREVWECAKCGIE